jgi:hypothetical protein
MIPVVLRWAQYLCSLKYALNILLIVEFGEKSCSAGAESLCEELLRSNEVEVDLKWLYYLVLFLLFLIFRVGAMFLLMARARTVF